jgi:hypothetical protein
VRAAQRPARQAADVSSGLLAAPAAGFTAVLVVIAIGALTAIVPALLVPRITVDA